jgi:DNA polymerase-3 subunit gamma/tau
MSYQVIARKHRPQTFDDVVGQRLITDTLKNAILTERVAHGYIFSGARGVGKTTTARILAKALNCAKGPSVTPCGDCPSCQEIAAGNSVDVMEIDAASNRGIDEIRELRENVRYLPARDRYKIFIIDEAHMLTTEAFNALLKTLEEPPPRSLFILATTEPHKLPPTIQSRCQHFSFRLLDYEEILSRLKWVCGQEGVETDEGALSAVTQAAEGSMRDGLSFLDQVIASCGNRLEESRVRQVLGVVPTELMNDMVRAIHDGNSRRVLEQLGRVAAEGYELAHFSGELTSTVRNLMVVKSCGAESPLVQVPQEERGQLAELARLFGEEDLARFFNILLRTESEMRYSLQPRFHLELGLMKLVHARRLASLETLLAQLSQHGTPEKTGGAAPRTGGVVPVRSDPLKAQGSQPPRENRSTAPARPEPRSAPAASPEAVLPTAAASTAGEDPRLESIKTILFDQKKRLLSSCLDHLSGCRFENGEARFFFSHKDSFYCDILNGHEQQQAFRSACTQVLGQPVRIYVTLEEQGAEAQAPRLSARERAERDPGVEAFVRKLDGKLVDVQDLSQE